MGGGCGICAEHYEIVIPLVTCGVNTFLVIEPEQRIRVTPVHWQRGISALVGPARITKQIGTVGASRFTNVALIETEIPGWRVDEAGTGRGRDLILGDPSPAE